MLPTPEECTLKQYESMTGEQQAAFFAQFSDGAAFFEWLVKAQAEDKANSGDIEVGSDSTIDIDNIFGNQ